MWLTTAVAALLLTLPVCMAQDYDFAPFPVGEADHSLTGTGDVATSQQGLGKRHRSKARERQADHRVAALARIKRQSPSASRRKAERSSSNTATSRRPEAPVGLSGEQLAAALAKVCVCVC